MNVGKVIAAMLGLIVLFLLLTRAAEANAIIRTTTGWITQQTAQLQGYNTGRYGAPYGGTAPTQKITQPLFS